MPPKTLVKVGIAGVLLPLAVFWMTSHWIDTRSFEPVNMLVVLKAGRPQTVDFEINLQENYYVGLSADYSLDDWSDGKCNSKTLADADWKVYRLQTGTATSKELWASPEREGQVPIGFRGLRGKYQLEWSVSDAAMCLNARHPQLSVWTSQDEYRTAFGFVLLACILIAMVGAGSVLRALVISLQGAPGPRRALRIFPNMSMTNVIPLPRHRPMPIMRVLPDFRIAWFCIIGVLTILFFLFLTGWGIKSNGLTVDFKGERSVIVEKNPWAETMAVYVDKKRAFCVNGKKVPREELRSKLEEELLRRGVWVVYLEADENCLYMDAVYAMDTIQGLGARLIWITPKTREEWKKRAAFTIANHASRVP